jgi:hypothetical protein
LDKKAQGIRRKVQGNLLITLFVLFQVPIPFALDFRFISENWIPASAGMT